MEQESLRESRSHDWYIALELILEYQDGDVTFESTAESDEDFEAHVRSALGRAEQVVATAKPNASTVSAVLRLSREALSTPPINLPAELVGRLAAIDATVDIDSYLVDPDRVLPRKVRSEIAS